MNEEQKIEWKNFWYNVTDTLIQQDRKPVIMISVSGPDKSDRVRYAIPMGMNIPSIAQILREVADRMDTGNYGDTITFHKL